MLNYQDLNAYPLDSITKQALQDKLKELVGLLKAKDEKMRDFTASQ